MTNDLLINLDKSTSKKIVAGSSSANKTEGSEKKEGLSLFDSFLSQAKKETTTTKEENSSSKNTDSSSDNKKADISTDGKKVDSSSDNKKTDISTDGKKVDNSLENTNDKKSNITSENRVDNKTDKNSESKATTTQAVNQVNRLDLLNNVETTSSNKTELTDLKQTQSLKNMVDKLVDIVVSAAKEVFSKTSNIKNNNELDSMVKNTVEEVVNNKLSDLSSKEKLKTLIDDKLEIIKNSVDTIKTKIGEETLEKEIKATPTSDAKNLETKINLSANNDKNTENIEKKETIPFKNETTSAIEVKELDNLVEKEVKNIKQNVQEIKKEVSNIIEDIIEKSNSSESSEKLDKIISTDKSNSSEIAEKTTKSENSEKAVDSEKIESNNKLNKLENLEKVIVSEKPSTTEETEVSKKQDDAETPSKPNTIQNNVALNIDDSKVETVLKEELNDLQTIKKEVSNILSEVVGKTDQDNKVNLELKKEIDTNLKTINVSSDEITVEVEKLNQNENKNDLKNIHDKVDTKIEVIKDAVTTIKEKVSEIIIVKTTVDTNIDPKSTVFNGSNISINAAANLAGAQVATNLGQNTKSKIVVSNEKPLLATMFLNAQKSIKEKTSMEQVHDAKTNIVDKKTVEAVKTSANKLDLNLDKAEVKSEGDQEKKSVPLETKKEESKVSTLFNSRDLNRAFLDQRMETTQLANQRNQQMIQQQEQVSLLEESKKAVETVELAVPREAVQVIQAKIIGAHQKMGSFMSEVARNMYLNYKPPVTAFRVNLNPANLGSISIIMKANKVDNSLSVSMNLSNSNTMEAFTENKVALQNAIQRQFSETSNVSVNFNMQDQSSQDSFGQSNQNGKQEEQNNNSNSNSENTDNSEEQEIIEHNDYM